MSSGGLARLLVALGLAAVVVACGRQRGANADDGPSGMQIGNADGGPTGDAVAGLRTAVAATCAKAHECRANFALGEAFFAQLFGGTAAACEMQIVTSFGPSWESQLREAVAAGRTRYDAGSAARCNMEQGALMCDRFWMEMDTASCDAAFVGTVEDGASCVIDPECVSGECSGMNSLPGQCVPEMAP